MEDVHGRREVELLSVRMGLVLLRLGDLFVRLEFAIRRGISHRGVTANGLEYAGHMEVGGNRDGMEVGANRDGMEVGLRCVRMADGWNRDGMGVE